MGSRRLVVPASIVLLQLSACSSESSITPPAPDAAAPDTKAQAEAFMQEEVRTAESCALQCEQPCSEVQTPFACPAHRPWDSIPHDTAKEACGDWDGQSMPAPQAGKCTVSEPSGEAQLPTSTTSSPVILPDGRRLRPAGHGWVLTDNLQGTFPFSALWVPGTPFVVISDDGFVDHALRVLDLRKLEQDQDPQVFVQHFAYPESLNYGLALAKDRTLYAASGKLESKIFAFSINETTGELTRLPNKDISLVTPEQDDSFPMGIDISPDGNHLLVAQVNESDALIYDLKADNYGRRLASFATGDQDQFAAVFDPLDSNLAYVSVWNRKRVVEYNFSTQQKRTIETGKQPQEIVFFDANYMGVTASLSDEIAIIDRAAGQVVSTIPIDPENKKRALSPTALAYDGARHRLYTTLATLNGLAVFDVTPSQGPGVPPKVEPAGVIPTYWWPTDIVVTDAQSPAPGSLFVISGKGIGSGANTDGDAITAAGQIRGAVQLIPYPDSSALASYTEAFLDTQKIGERAGNAEVSCPEGAAYDFPIPRTNAEGPSKYIKHVIFLLRENKTYDAIMGDVPGRGQADLVMIPGKMEEAFGNTRTLARTFSHGDNFYHSAEQSIQGHFWTVFARSSDYTERTWLSTWGRGTRSIPLQGVIEATRPEEGGLFDWLRANDVSFDNMGEQLDNPGLDPQFGASGYVSPGGTRPDTLNACYISGRARVLCNLKSFTYAWLVNDHTFGGQAGMPNPGLMIAVNDEATGMVVDGLSHSPLWKESLVIVIEDDPQDGADHIDSHRSIFVMASPWIRRGYVSHGHYDPASIHKLIAHIFGIPYNNEMVARAALPLDMFSSTPDYSPFTYKPRGWTDQSCNSAASRSSIEAESMAWDFDEPDDQPGLSQQLWRMLHKGQR